MPGSTQPSLLSTDTPCSITLVLKVAANGAYIWGNLTTLEHSGRARRRTIPHTYFGAAVLSLPDDMRDVFTAWLYHDATEVHRTVARAVEGWQDDCDDEGGHPARNR